MRILRSASPSTVLVAGQAVALGIGLAVPMLLSRRLTVEEFGAYRLLMLLQLMLSILGSMGFDGGLFRHVRTEGFKPAFQGALSAVWGLAAGATLAATLYLTTPLWSAGLGAPELAPYAGYLCLLVILAMPTAHVEHLLLATDRVRASALVVALQALGCAVAVVVGTWVMDSLAAIFAGLVFWYSLRLVVVAGIYWRLLGKDPIPLRQWWAQFRHHLHFGLPIGGNNFLIALGRMDRFLVSGLFGVAGFARYSVGCLEVPMARQWIETTQNLAAVRAVDLQRDVGFDEARRYWLRACGKVALYLLPIVALCVLMAESLLTLAFGGNYADSAPIFQIFVIGILVAAFDPELFLRATKFAHLSLWMNLVTIGGFVAAVALLAMTEQLTLTGLVALRVGTEALAALGKYALLPAKSRSDDSLQLIVLGGPTGHAPNLVSIGDQ